jgi:flavodoxin
MRILVIADSQFGNTATVAAAITRGASAEGDVSLLTASEADLPTLLAQETNLLLIGGPTVNRRMTAALERCVDAASAGGSGLTAATFDTRLRGSELLMGSAARSAAQRLAKSGVRLVAPKESFYVVRAEAPPGVRATPGTVRLADGEEQRAEAWGRTVARAAATR